MTRLTFVIAIVAIGILASPTNGAWGSGAYCPPAAVAAQEVPFSGWYPCEGYPHILGWYDNGVQTGLYNTQKHLWRDYDRATNTFGPPKRAPWLKKDTPCPCDGCNCDTTGECVCDECKCENCEGRKGAVVNPASAMDLPQEIRQWFRNPDGSCVQCSIGMCGVDQNVPEASTLLWDTDYGKAERGGSNPQRVAAYAKTRGIHIYNVTGSNTWDWMRWAAMTGRGCAIGAGSSHFQTLYGYDPATKTWMVVNNNGDQRVDTYTDDQFRRLHLASGQWCVILDYPPHPARAAYKKWWAARGDEVMRSAPKPEVDKDAVLRLGNMVQAINGEVCDDGQDAFVQAMAPPADDSNKWFISIVSMQNCVPCTKLKQDWASNQDLRAFAKPDSPKDSWAHFAIYDKDDDSQQFRFTGLKITAYPTIIVQPPRSGVYGDPSTVVFQKTGYNGNARQLAQGMADAIKKYVAKLPKKMGPFNPEGPRTPPFKPTPKVEPIAPPVMPGPVPTPDVPPPPDPVPDDNNDLVWKLVVGAIAVLTILKGGKS